MADTSLQERRRYNDTIEATDLACAIDARDIHTFRQTERNASVIGLYERMYSDFDLLVILTSNLGKTVKDSSITTSAHSWLDQHRNVQGMTEKKILGICDEGADIFVAYHNLLIDQGFISLPVR
jgi:hypothetical protein